MSRPSDSPDPTNPAPRLILASTSPWRKELLARLQIPFEVESPAVVETALPDEKAEAMARRLALAKAQRVADEHPGEDVVVIGSDQTCTLEGQSLRKPGTPDRARRQLLHASGKTLSFVTAVAVVRAQRQQRIVDHAEIQATLRSLLPDEVEQYLLREPAFDCVGGFRIEALGISLFDQVISDDPTALIGLPLIRTVRLLRQVGLNPLS